MDAKAKAKEYKAKWKAPTAASNSGGSGGGGGDDINSNVAAGPKSSSDGIVAGYSKEQALAREYAETTIFFADLVGFTKWSSARSPTEVFHLLETLYGEFDKIATRRNVFKVETIGDW